MKLLPIALSGLLLAPLAAESPAPTRIHVNASASAGGDGTSWATAFTSLQDALGAAAGTVGDDEIWIAAGTYTPDPGGTDTTRVFQLADGVAIYGGFEGTESTLGDRDPDPSTNGNVLSGDLLGDDGPDFANRTDNSLRVVDCSDVDDTAVLEGFTITGGNATTYPSNLGAGLGGTGSPVIRHCRFVENQAAFAGGAIAIGKTGVASSLLFEACEFTGNKASTYGGAADLNSTSAVFVNCRFTYNQSSFYGGAVHNYYASRHFSHCSFRGNQAMFNGGAFYFNNGTPRLDNSEFVGNLANFGGGIYCFANARPVMTNVSFQGNAATSQGGGIYKRLDSAPSFVNCLVWHNAAAGATNSLSASVAVGSGAPSFSHCTVQHSGGSSNWEAAAGSDNGSNQDTDPLFASTADPLSAPTTTGNLTIGATSPAIDAGLDTADLDGSGPGTDTTASIGTDLAGNPRFEGSTVDVGAYEHFEGTVATSFASLFPALEPGEDDNGNGLTNFTD